MDTMIDTIGSMIVAGLVVLAVMRMNISLSETGSNTNVEVITQEDLTSIADDIVYDFYKIGYRASPPIIFADTSAITFLADMHRDGNVDTVHYSLSSPISSSGLNPNMRVLYRVINSNPAAGASLGLTGFNLSYYDSTGTQITIPASGTTSQSILSKIKSIKVRVMVQSPTKTDSTYASSYWEEFISPKNLRTLM